MGFSIISAWRRGLVVAVGLAGIAASDAHAQTTLRWKFQSGETLKYALNQTTKIRISLNQQTYENSMTQMIDTTWTVKDVADGTAQIAQSIDRIRTTIVTPAGEIAYDSKEGTVPEGPFNVIAPIMKALAGAEIMFKMNPRGEVSDVTLPPKVVEAITSMPNAPNANPMFSEEGIKKMISQSTLALPEKPLAVGDNWSTTSEIQAPPVGSLMLTNTYTYRGSEGQSGGPLQRIDVAIKTDIKAAEGGPPITVKEQDSSGLYQFDNERGRLDQSSITQKMEMVVKANNMEITQSNESNSTMKLNP